MIEIFIKLTNVFSKFLGYIAAILLAISVLVVCHMVFNRFVLNHPTSWQTEFVTYSLLASTFLGAPWVLLTRGHVNVELIPLMLGHRSRYALALFAYSLSLILCLILTWYSYLFWLEAWETGWSSDTIWGPKLWKAYLSMPIGFLAISLQYLADLICLLNGQEHPFGIEPTTPPEAS